MGPALGWARFKLGAPPRLSAKLFALHLIIIRRARRLLIRLLALLTRPPTLLVLLRRHLAPIGLIARLTIALIGIVRLIGHDVLLPTLKFKGADFRVSVSGKVTAQR